MDIVKSKRIDETMAREKFETALKEHEQIFEHFFIAKFLGLNFEYLNFNNDGPDNEMLKSHLCNQCFKPRNFTRRSDYSNDILAIF